MIIVGGLCNSSTSISLKLSAKYGRSFGLPGCEGGDMLYCKEGSRMAPGGCLLKGTCSLRLCLYLGRPYAGGIYS